MGDIDDFFAKKDKKKKGGSKKGFSKANAEVIAKNLIKTDEKEVKDADKDMVAQLSEEKPVTAQNSTEDEEWDDYRENKKDFTGLKIENLVIEDKVVEEEEDETEINEDGEVVKVVKDRSGPWSKITGQQQEEHHEPQQKQENTPEPDPSMPNVVGGSYVPPHMRGAGGGSAPAAEPQQRRPMPRRNRNAPDITSEVYFPSLSSASDDGAPKGAWGNRAASRQEAAFEEVRERSNQSYSKQADAPKLVMTNKFDALRD